jgi:hypothetical protein
MVNVDKQISKVPRDYPDSLVTKPKLPASQPETQAQPQDGYAARPLPESFDLTWNGRRVSGHLLEDPRHLESPSTREKIRVFGRSAGGKVAVVDFSQLTSPEKDTQSSLLFGVKESQLFDQYYKNEAERATRFAETEPTSLGRVLPKDHSLHIQHMEISVGVAAESDVYFEQLTDIGSVEGFHIFGIAQTGQAAAVESTMAAKKGHNYTLYESDVNEVWLEDYGEPTVGGHRLVPAFIDQNLHGTDFIVNAQNDGRTERLRSSGLSTDFPLQGGVNESYFQYVAIAQSAVLGQKSHHGLSYLEGGNILPGTRPDGTPYLIVGADSYAITERLMQKQSGLNPTREAVIKAIASDTGMRPEQVTIIEQPGEFHIDMRMMPIGPGELIVQDSRLAAAQQAAWLEEEGALTPESQQKLDSWSQKMSAYEDLSSRQLEEAGFKVHRVAGAFPDLDAEEPTDAVNFFNGRHGTNKDGQRFSILMGASPKQEAYFAQLLLDKLQAPIDRIYFTDPEITAATLELQGGLKCRTKALGTVTQSITHTLEPAPSCPTTLAQIELF